jgi:hypothetical protein
MPQWGQNEKDKVLEGFRSHPVMRISVESKGYDSEQNVESKGKAVEEGGEAILYINIEKENNCSNRVIIQKHTKIKDVTWWILVGDQQNNLLGVRKASIKKKVSIKMQIDLPDDLHKNPVHVYLMADSYAGLDQQVKVQFKIKDE